jgi:hypothetical protein
MSEQRKLAAILAADVVGFSRMVDACSGIIAFRCAPVPAYAVLCGFSGAVLMWR